MRIPHGLRAAAGAGGGGAPWEVAGATFDGTPVNFFFVGAQDNSPQGVVFKSDGTKMYTVGVQFDSVHEYNLSSPWNVNTASFLQSASVSQDTLPSGLHFKPDGTKLYVTGNGLNYLFEYDLSTAWDISSIAYLQSFTVGGAPEGVFFKPDGTKMYIADAGTGMPIKEYSLSTPWDITTSTFVTSFSVSAQEGGLRDVFFKSDGTKMFITGIGDHISEYTLGTAWDISTASYIQQFSILAQEATATGLYFKDDGATAYIVGSSSDTVWSYQLSTPWDVSTASFSYPTTDYLAVSGLSNQANGLDFKPDGSQMFTISGNNINIYSLSTPWDITSATLSSNYSSNADSGIHFKSDGTRVVLSNTGSGVWSDFLSTPWNPNTSTSNYYLSFAAIDVYMRDDGLKMYLCSAYVTNQIREYTLSTAWQVDTATFVQSLSAAALDTSIQGIHFKPDGTKMYLAGLNSNAIHQYDLSTPWDLSTASFVASGSVLAATKFPRSVRFRDDDGTEMFVGTQVDIVGFNLV